MRPRVCAPAGLLVDFPTIVEAPPPGRYAYSAFGRIVDAAERIAALAPNL